MKPTPKNSLSWKVISLVVFGVALIAIWLCLHLAVQLKRLQDPTYQQSLADRETAEIMEEVGEVYLLPEGTPQIATVSNPDELKKDQPFFAKAEIGDRVLIYADQAILYRPSTDQVINVGPVNRTTPKEEIINNK